MTREEAIVLLPIIQALAEGKSIQNKIEGLTGWIDTDEIYPEYDGRKVIYRIKSEPKYRPFKTQEECWNEMLKHQPFGWVKRKETEEYSNIIGICKISGITNILMSDCACAFPEFFDEFIFIDGTPFGIKE